MAEPEHMSIDDYKVLVGTKAATPKRNKRSKEKEKLGQYLMYGGDPWVTEYRFHPTRQWPADWALIEDGRQGLLVEFEGGVFTDGGHVRGDHYSSDCEKYSEASILGFMLVRVTAPMVRSGLAFDLISRAVKARINVPENGTSSYERTLDAAQDGPGCKQA